MRTPNWKKIKTDAAYRARMERRSEIVSHVRAFFRDRGFFEAETPVVVRHPGMEPNLDPFETTVAAADGREHPAFLITSPEYALKKLLAGGIGKVFEIARCFRNGEPWDGGHDPQFTMIEWYRAGQDYEALMRDTEELVASAAERFLGGTSITYRGTAIDLAAPWPRMTVAEAFERHAGIDLGAGIDDPERFRADVAAKGCAVGPADAFDDVFFKIFLRDVEPALASGGRPVILRDYPRSMAALARLKDADPRYAERFEAYCGGLELCNAYSELTDAVEQRRRLEAERSQRAAMGKKAFEIDEQFIEAVGMMPACAGIAFGVDRLVMLLTDAPSIRDVLFFPAEDLFG
jgi:lysyl-tRNA synthetase class 2